MSRNSYTKSQIFLLEFIITVLFFAICATVCVSAFVKADRLSEGSRDRNKASIVMQSAAECVKSLAGEALSAEPVSEAAKALSEHMNAVPQGSGDTSLVVYYDAGFNPAEKDSAKYAMSIELRLEEEMLAAEISMGGLAKCPVLTVKKYIANEE